MTRWAILTGEYPPQPGGVSDYTRLVAEGLVEAGDRVTVFAPVCEAQTELASTVRVVRLTDRYGPRGRREAEAILAAEKPDRVLVQYVPHAYGRKAMNLPFVRWVARRVARIAPIWTMFHEVAVPVRWWPPQHALLAAVTRRMAATLARASGRVFVSIPTWGEVLRRIEPRTRLAHWLPVPCTLETDADPTEVAGLKRRFSPAGSPLVGHFGTFGPLITNLLTPTLGRLQRLAGTMSVLLIGRGSESFAHQFASANPTLAGRVAATGELPSSVVAAHLRACDLLVQPYPDGVSSRRTSAMAALANGVPLVTNLGPLSEPLWADGAVAAVSPPTPDAMADLASSLIADTTHRLELGRQGCELYRRTFAVEHTIRALREPT